MLKYSARRFVTCSLVAFAIKVLAGQSGAAESVTAPRPIPLTRPEMKEFLEDMKGRALRIPLPELTDAAREELGERATGYEARLRYHYMQLADGQGPGGQG
ncbi:MAG: hypothetical protein WCJ09_29130, partial [Planctomycetota bacterium]